LKAMDQQLQSLKSIVSWIHSIQVTWSLLDETPWKLYLEFKGIIQEIVIDWQWMILLHRSDQSIVSIHVTPIKATWETYLNLLQDIPLTIEIYLMKISTSGKGRNHEGRRVVYTVL
jgi:hypothetical protein